MNMIKLVNEWVKPVRQSSGLRVGDAFSRNLIQTKSERIPLCLKRTVQPNERIRT